MRTFATLQQGAVVAASLVIAALLLLTIGRPVAVAPADLWLAAVIIGVVAAAQHYAAIIQARGRMPLDAGVIFGAALLAQPGIAVLLVLAGVLLAQGVECIRASRGRRTDAVLDNRRRTVEIGQAVIQTAVVGVILTLGGWTPGQEQALTPGSVIALVCAVLAVWLIGTWVSTARIALETGLPQRRLWLQAAPHALLDSLPLFGLGLLGALVAASHAWALPLVLLPGIAWYRSIEERADRRNLDDFVESLADTVDGRDRHTLEHSRRVAEYAGLLATEMGLAPADVELVTRAARVHDIGNVTIERAMLVRDDTLSGEEWRTVKRHPVTGSDLLLRFPSYASTALLVRYHHERMDGSGYPDGLYGERIPIGARIIAVADALDAMTSTRPYRPALPAGVIREEFARQRDCQWDGQVVDALLRLVERGTLHLPGDERLSDYIALEVTADGLAGALPSPRGGSAMQPVAGRSERTALETQLMHQVFHDPLTGLPNRALFMDRLEHALTRIRRSPDAVAVIFVDLDNFKTINDTWGHQSGDLVLIEVARRLEQCLRPGDTVARLSGDELTLLIENAQVLEDAISVVQRMVSALAAPIALAHDAVLVTASIGIAFSSTGREGAAELLHNADTAMYRAKKDGKAGYAIFEPGMRNDAAGMVELKQDISHAIERGELRVFYQPKAMLDSGRIAGMEALVRWQHPERGLVLPAEFLPAAEHTGIVVEIDQLVLRDALRQVSAWRMAQAGGPPLVVSVNISARSFANPALPEEITKLLAEFRLDPRALMLEITEDVAMADPEASIERFARLKQVGILLAIDNFGAGSSSLNYLKRFSVDTLKIARSFVDGLGYDPGDTAVVRAIIAFASTLRRTVAAEGIETAEQFFQLRGLGCEQGQGNHLAPPLSRETISALVAGSATLPLGRVGRGEFLAPLQAFERPAPAGAPPRRVAEASS